MRILVVEDEVKIRTGLVSLIRAHTPYKVVGEAKNGLEGLDLLQSLKPDLVITDIKMPEMDGLQMLKSVQNMGVRQHAVILSGYSEFEYAQKALRVGVDDYLLKPLTADDVVTLLQRIAKMIDQENNHWLEGMSRVLQQAMMQKEGDIALPPDLHTQIFAPNRCNIAFMGPVKVAGVVDKALFQQCIDALCAEEESLHCFSFYYDNPHELGCLLSAELDESDLIALFEKHFLKSRSLTVGWSAVTICSEGDFCGAYQQLRDLIAFGMVLDTNHILTSAYSQTYLYQKLEYPQQIAAALHKCICKNDFEGIAERGESFIDFLQSIPYHPAQIYEAYAKLFEMILDTVQEFDSVLYQQLVKQDYFERLNLAYRFEELANALRDLISQLGRTQKRNDIRNFVIMKAMNYVRENYQNGITLEEIAQFLGLTPEYLGTLFNREIGTNFSSFIRDFRLSHAKRLLKSSDMKIYEIAVKVGYSDVKYFNRVFKEQEGVSPKEYRGKKQGVEF